MKNLLLSAALVLSMSVAANAEEAKSGWTGEGQLSAGQTSGNTDTRDIGLGLKLTNTIGKWAVGGEAIG